jgi:hypothetical protein
MTDFILNIIGVASIECVFVLIVFLIAIIDT